PAGPGIFAFTRQALGHDGMFVAINTTVDDLTLTVPAHFSTVVLATTVEAEGRFVEGEIILPALAALVIASR
ncbi:MAG: hypothetical protein ABI305_13295, partial [Tepidiformaceae bacterium]